MKRRLPLLSIFFAVYWLPHGHSQSYGPRAHSHNDYEQQRPFHHAFSRGFQSIEADVWLMDGQLLVSHERKDAKSERSLAAMYLDPLNERHGRKGRWKKGPKDRKLQLLIDIK